MRKGRAGEWTGARASWSPLSVSLCKWGSFATRSPSVPLARRAAFETVLEDVRSADAEGVEVACRESRADVSRRIEGEAPDGTVELDHVLVVEIDAADLAAGVEGEVAIAVHRVPVEAVDVEGVGDAERGAVEKERPGR